MPISLGIGTAITRGGGLYGPPAQLDLNFASLLSLTPSVGPTPSYTRASTGTYFDSSGVLILAAINGPRFDYVYNGSSWVSKGLLVEEQRTNLNLYSEQFNNVAYSISQATIATNQAVSPDANTTAESVTASAGVVRPEVYQAAVTVLSSVYTFSIYLKKNTHDFVQIVLPTVGNGFANFDISSGVLGTLGAGGSATSSIVNVGNGWYRCTITYTAAGTASVGYIQLIGSATAARVATFTAAGTESVYLWGQQLELGAFPTSYIPTTTASVTRSADVCQITGGDFSGFWNQSAGALALEGDTPASGTKSLVSADNATANESTILRTLATDPLFIVTDGGVAQASIDAGTVVSGTGFKLAAAYTVNDFAVSKDGAAVVTDSSGTIPTPTQLNIGSDASGNYVCGHIARLRYFNTRLTNSQLVALST